jgi:PmbA protein
LQKISLLASLGWWKARCSDKRLHMENRSHLDSLALVLDTARKLGADAADAIVMGESSLSIGWRMGTLEDVSRSESQDLGLRVFIGQAQAMVSSSDLSGPALKALAERAVAMARLAPDDKYAGLADPDALLTGALPELDLFDSTDVSPQQLKSWASAAEDAARAVPGVTNSEGSSATFGGGAVALATSTGFSGSYKSSHVGISASVIAARDGAMERDYAYDHVRHCSDLRGAELIGREAGELTVKRLGAIKPDSGTLPVIFDPRISGGMVGHLLGAINGQSVARKSTFLLDALGTKIFAPGVQILEEPHRWRGLRSRAFDGEGLPTQNRALIENGILTTWLLDCASARQLGLASTGHAARGIGSPPSPSASNVHMAAGSVSPQDMIKSVKRGIYVTELIGQGVNGVTGDYSRGASGFLIENGELTSAVNEFTIAGNLKDMFARLVPASDLEFRYGINAPTLMIEGMSIAGA